jgi:Gas vesicle protein K
VVDASWSAASGWFVPPAGKFPKSRESYGVSAVAKTQGQEAPLPAHSWQANRSAVERLEPELKELRILAEQILSHRREILVRWHDLYAVCGLSCSLRKEDFFHFLGDAIARGKDDLESGRLREDDCERVGLALMKQSEQIEKLREAFGLSEQDLNLDLGPLGKLL